MRALYRAAQAYPATGFDTWIDGKMAASNWTGTRVVDDTIVDIMDGSWITDTKIATWIFRAPVC